MKVEITPSEGVSGWGGSYYFNPGVKSSRRVTTTSAFALRTLLPTHVQYQPHARGCFSCWSWLRSCCPSTNGLGGAELTVEWRLASPHVLASVPRFVGLPQRRPHALSVHQSSTTRRVREHTMCRHDSGQIGSAESRVITVALGTRGEEEESSEIPQRV